MFIYTRYVKLDTKIHLVLVDLSSAFEGPKLKLNWTIYEGCPESIQPFCISREPTAWTWCNVAASQRRPYCASVNSHSPVGLVSRQWDAVDWACVLCDSRIYNDRASRLVSPRQRACPIYSSRAGFFWRSITSPRSLSPSTDHIWLPATCGFSQS